MSNRTFAALLAAFVMLLGTAAGLWRNTADDMEQRRDNLQELSAEIQLGERFCAPVSGEVTQPFGAYYNKQYGQWTMNTEVKYASVLYEAVCAPLSGFVKEIAANAEGGSRVVLECGDWQISLYPVYDVRVFLKSGVKQGDVLGRAHEEVTVYVQKQNTVVDPLSAELMVTFESGAGAEGICVE